MRLGSIGLLGFTLVTACTAPQRPLVFLRAGPAIAPYGGAVRTGACEIRFEPASRAELDARSATIRTRLPEGARFELTPLGDRVLRASFPFGRRDKLHEREASKVAERFARQTHLLWGVRPDSLHVQGTDRDDDKRWVIQLAGITSAKPAWGAEEIRVIVRLDPNRGRLEAGLKTPPMPPARVCESAPAALDHARLRAAVIRLEPSYTADDVSDPFESYRVDSDPERGWIARRVALVGVGPGLRARMAAAGSWAAGQVLREILVLDPDTATLLARDIPPRDVYDEEIDPVGFADRVLGARD